MSDRFEIVDTPLSGVRVLERKPRSDERGWLERIYDSEELADVLGVDPIVQVNWTLTRERGSVRGMHYQVAPSAETKIVSCLRGAVFDVAVDLRRGSPTFLRWHAETLDAKGRRSLVIPEGCAHGYQALADDCELLYLHSAAYDPVAEGGVNPRDPRLAIAWPLPIGQLSDRDASFAPLDEAFGGVEG
ncbi:MAG TPA: dTDP-4-dehydrorhamnose 3,5-epimerase family protein [Candidatus Limnocylindria bacterium]|nr:dTDP-4-dehydrorhamnose 3,5-epimerase family protein [Candidatus Limnocylindria bacterium]